jgi:hypothetical protein
MSESPWSDESAAAPKKKSVPTWAWWVGGGCLFMLLALAVAVFVIFSFVKKATDPERQWPEIAQVLAYDKRPENLTLIWGSQVGLDMFVFHDQKGLVVLLMRLPSDEANKSRKQMFDDKQTFTLMGKGGRHSMQPGTIKVQGRELQALRFVQEGGPSKTTAGEPSTGSGGSMLVDVTPEDAERPVILQVTRANGSDEPISDQTIIDILAPFHVGPER